jgi:hypothetical protein
MRPGPTLVAAVERMLVLAARKDRTMMRQCTEFLWTIQRVAILDRSNILHPLSLI